MTGRASVQDLIGASQHLRELRRASDELAAATRRLDTFLGEAMSGQCQVARMDARQVVLVTRSPAWATRLRFLAPTLAAHFAAELRLEREPHVAIRVDPPRAALREQRRSGLSQRSAELLRSVAAASDDPRMRATLLRLAARAGQADPGGGERGD